MGILDTIRNIGGNILTGARNIGGNILTGIDTIRDKIRSISRQARKIPLVNTLLKAKIPVIGQSADDIGNFADEVIDETKDIAGRLGIRSAKDRIREAD